MQTEPPKRENLLRGNAYIHAADPGQQIEFSRTGTKYTVQACGALKRTEPKLNKKQRRALRNNQTHEHLPNPP